jgi:hypothetical protein
VTWPRRQRPQRLAIGWWQAIVSRRQSGPRVRQKNGTSRSVREHVQDHNQQDQSCCQCRRSDNLARLAVGSHLPLTRENPMSRTIRVLLVFVAAVGVFAKRANAQIPSAGGVFYACVHLDRDSDEGRQLRLVAAGEPCRRNETRVHWAHVQRKSHLAPITVRRSRPSHLSLIENGCSSGQEDQPPTPTRRCSSNCANCCRPRNLRPCRARGSDNDQPPLG